MQMTIEGVTFTLNLIENPASQTLLANLPLTLTMDDLHRNEKYASLDQSYPIQPQSVGQINAGDVMLFGSNTLVIFYDSFSTSYAYTPIGQISEVDQLISLLNHNQAVEIPFTLE
ncbi:cyclophilin-like fold protein [Fundicoccus culcitae]|uniref:Cyclophilin-like fold protein n=1 Tax=Fundicoccus culcitae TaxID=2969821 RepID=A0ABY5P209_9LACT|nr:cyclophilin-like fold protein [Fundicoccus culcitae]UUX32741.1 cyclophilin-like fold protein [Fundicoccus culcitae]